MPAKAEPKIRAVMTTVFDSLLSNTPPEARPVDAAHAIQ
jgi:hypothetical protein